MTEPKEKYVTLTEETYSELCLFASKGDALDRIRTELKEDSDKWQNTLFGDGIRYCLRIIDKYRESE